MASIYIRGGMYWIKFYDPLRPLFDEHQKLVPRRESTGFRTGDAQEKRKAYELEARYTLRERRGNKAHISERWEAWVHAFFDLRWPGADNLTRARAKTSWGIIRLFLDEHEIDLPRQFVRAHAFKLIDWRTHPAPGSGRKAVRHNTALQELKLISVALNEAAARGYCDHNPCLRLGIKKEAVREKPELPADIVQRIRKEVRRWGRRAADREAMINSFEIAYYHGVRLSATYLNPLEDVWEQAGQWFIRFTQKGKKTSVKVLHPKLIPLFQRLRKAGRTETYRKPPRVGWLSQRWHRFLKVRGIRAALPGVSFHSTRVTVATKLARNGVPKLVAMEYVDHASTTVHRGYVRLSPQDFSKPCHEAIK